MASPDPDHKESNEQDDEIPYFTKVCLSKNRINNINMDKYASKRVMRLFISHLIDEQIVKRSTSLERHFSFSKFTFKTIKVRGIITSIQKLSSNMKHNLYISVDDGTSALDCFIEENLPLENAKVEIQSHVQDYGELLKINPENSTAKAALMMLQSSNDIVKNSPHYSKLELGNIVELIGTLSEYNNKRICFVINLTIVDSSGNVEYLESLHNLYETIYVK